MIAFRDMQLAPASLLKQPPPVWRNGGFNDHQTAKETVADVMISSSADQDDSHSRSRSGITNRY